MKIKERESVGVLWEREGEREWEEEGEGGEVLLRDRESSCDGADLKGK